MTVKKQGTTKLYKFFPNANGHSRKSTVAKPATHSDPTEQNKGGKHSPPEHRGS